jgi:hypothetical protein
MGKVNVWANKRPERPIHPIGPLTDPNGTGQEYTFTLRRRDFLDDTAASGEFRRLRMKYIDGIDADNPPIGLQIGGQDAIVTVDSLDLVCTLAAMQIPGDVEAYSAEEILIIAVTDPAVFEALEDKARAIQVTKQGN